MITLKIREPGFTVAIPGLKVFRTPADIDISKLDIRVISMYLKTSGITKYEIVAESDAGHKEVYTKKDFDVIKAKKKQKVDPDKKRIDRIEQMLEVLVSREVGKTSPDEEQINNKLDRLEKLFKNTKSQVQIIDKGQARRSSKNEEPDIEELDSFIPEIDVSDLKLSSGEKKTIKQDSDDLEDTADMLSGLIRK